MLKPPTKMRLRPLVLALLLAACGDDLSSVPNSRPPLPFDAGAPATDAVAALDPRDAGPDQEAAASAARVSCGAQVCTVSAPVCDATTNQCVECIADSDCASRQLCVAHHCLARCQTDTDCTGGDFRLGASNSRCDTTVNLCFPCVSDAHCSGGTPYCANHACVECKSDSDCLGPQHCRAGSCRWVRSDADATSRTGADASADAPIP